MLTYIRTPVADLMYSLNWCKLDRRWETQLLAEVFKCLKGLAPSYLSYQFSFTESMHTKCIHSQSSKTFSFHFGIIIRVSVLFIIEEPKYETNFHPMYDLVMVQ